MAAFASSIGVLGYLMFHPLPNCGLAAMLPDAAVCYGLTLLGYTFIVYSSLLEHHHFVGESQCTPMNIIISIRSLSSCIEFS